MQVLTAGRDDPDSLADLLADDFMAYAPILGPLKKKEVTNERVLHFCTATTAFLAGSNNLKALFKYRRTFWRGSEFRR